MSTEPLDRLLGSLIDGRYRVERAVGAGGFGTVYAAVHVGLGSPVALKVLELPDKLRPEQLAKLVGGFFEEARTLKRLRHPNIVTAFDVGLLPANEAGLQLPYIVMEWCSGPTLQQLLDDRAAQPMPPDEALRLFEPLVAAMAHAHAAGVAHRDLKPANVVLETAPDGTLVPRVIDFGIAKIVATEEAAGSGLTNTVSGSSPFTPRYAAPEQLAGARTGPWTDVHALGLVFVEMVTGRPAIGDDADAAMAGIDPVRPTPKARGVDVGALEPILARALALRPADRYPDAAALGQAMRAVTAAGSPAVQSGAHALAVADAAALARPSPHTIDRTAPPSSHTLRTASGTGRTAGPLALRRRRRTAWVVASFAAATLAVGAAAGVQRWRHAWPFPPMRLRDLDQAELDRRMAGTGLGSCASSKLPAGYMSGCQLGYLMVFSTNLPPATSLADARTHVNRMAVGMGAGGKAVRFAVDGDLAAILVTQPDRVATAFDHVLQDVVVDLRADVEEPPPPPPVEAKSSLGAWTGQDLLANVHAMGLHVSGESAAGFAPFVVVYQDGKTVILTLNMQGGPVALAAWRTNAGSPPMAYALDGDKLLTVAGDPSFMTVDFLRRVVGTARAEEFGTFP